jgi:hypothetical protein
MVSGQAKQQPVQDDLDVDLYLRGWAEKWSER